MIPFVQLLQLKPNQLTHIWLNGQSNYAQNKNFARLNRQCSLRIERIFFFSKFSLLLGCSAAYTTCQAGFLVSTIQHSRSTQWIYELKWQIYTINSDSYRKFCPRSHECKRSACHSSRSPFVDEQHTHTSAASIEQTIQRRRRENRQHYSHPASHKILVCFIIIRYYFSCTWFVLSSCHRNTRAEYIVVLWVHVADLLQRFQPSAKEGLTFHNFKYQKLQTIYLINSKWMSIVQQFSQLESRRSSRRHAGNATRSPSPDLVCMPTSRTKSEMNSNHCLCCWSMLINSPVISVNRMFVCGKESGQISSSQLHWAKLSGVRFFSAEIM